MRLKQIHKNEKQKIHLKQMAVTKSANNSKNNEIYSHIYTPVDKTKTAQK